MRHRIWLILLLGACTPNGTGADEVAAEVRALRQALLARPQAQPRTNDSATVDAAAALAPLREALQGLVTNQHELQQRQLSLTQEMQRWSVLLVEHGSNAQREETAALSARLQQLEASLQAQDARHREMERLLQGALDRTADRLGEFLRGVGAEVESGAEAPPPSQAAPPREPPVPAGDEPPVPRPDDRSASTGSHEAVPRTGALRWWWWSVGVLGLVVGALCWRRLRAAPTPATFGRQPAARTPAAPAAGGDPDVQEIWAAAALLGEAVGRLRDSSPAGPTAAEDDAPRATAGGIDADLDEDLIVLDDELLAVAGPLDLPRPAAAPASEVAPAEAGADRPMPIAATCRLRAADPARSLASVLQILQEDPRVLRRPEPAVRCSRDCLEASFRLVPDLPPGERCHLEQRLRDACGSAT